MPGEADYSTVDSIGRRLVEASDTLREMTGRVAKARQVREYDSDRRKRALSCAVKDFLGTGAKSIAEAEHKARSSESYGAAMENLRSQLENAERVIADWDAAKVAWESARSLLSIQKQIVTNI